MHIFVTILLLFIQYGVVAQCSSPNGAMSKSESTPPSYQYLEDNGYCMNGTGSTMWHYMAFTFTPDVSDLSINMGYTANCASVNTTNYSLYDASCTLVGTGLVYTGLTVNADYIFEVYMKASGGPFCLGFERVCPYWMPTNPLPIELIEFNCDQRSITWSTASEYNNDRFEVYSGLDLVEVVPGTNSSQTIDYKLEIDECYEYVELIQVDYDGTVYSLGTRKCNCPNNINSKVVDVYTLHGQRTNITRGGIFIIRYSNGVAKKVFK